MRKKHQRIIRYCRECKEKIEDETNNNSKLYCSLKCRKIADQKYQKRYYRKHRKLKGYKGMWANRRKNTKFPKWRCQECGYIIQLNFETRIWQNTKRLLSIKCPKCNLDSTVTQAERKKADASDSRP